MSAMMGRTWDDNWNSILRYVIFDDPIMQELMLLPKDINILHFVQKYWLEDENGGEQLTDEKVRIVVYDGENVDSGNKEVLMRSKHFDVYVRDDYLYDADPVDRLRKRTRLIKDRLKLLQTSEPHLFGMKFRFVDSYDQWTKMAGYKRYHVVFSYKETV